MSPVYVCAQVCARVSTYVRDFIHIYAYFYQSFCVLVGARVRLDVTFLCTMMLFTQPVKHIFVFMTARPAVLVHSYQHSSITQFCNVFCNALETKKKDFVTVVSFKAVWSRLKYFKA